MQDLVAFAPLQRATVRLLNMLLDSRTIRPGDGVDGSIRDMAGIIADQCAALRAMIEAGAIRGGPEAIANISGHTDREYLSQDQHYRALVLPALQFLRGATEGFASAVIVHGSQADRTYVPGWSDLDTLVLLRSSAVESAKCLLALRERLRGSWELLTEVCAYQHHAFLFLPEILMSAYDSSILPPNALHGAIALTEAATLRFAPLAQSGSGSMTSLRSRLLHSEDALMTRIYRHHGRDGVYLDIDFRNADDNMYQLFAYLNYMMLVPSLVLDALGTPCHKAQSFGRVRSLLDGRALAHLDLISGIRTEWGDRSGVGYRSNAIPSWVQERLGRNFFDEGAHLLRNAIEHCPPA